jgi:SAM-dependent methyltransferase
MERIVGMSDMVWPDEDVVRGVARAFGSIPREARHTLQALDVGFGTGRHIVYLLREGFSVSGLDYAENAMASATARVEQLGLKADLRLEELGTATFPLASFDLIIAWGALFLKPDEEMQSDLHTVHELLRPGGVLVADFRTPRNWFHGLGAPVGDHGFQLDERAGPYAGSF